MKVLSLRISSWCAILNKKISAWSVLLVLFSSVILISYYHNNDMILPSLLDYVNMEYIIVLWLNRSGQRPCLVRAQFGATHILGARHCICHIEI